MKKIMFTFVFGLMLVSATAFADNKVNNIEFGAGVFTPSSDYKSAWDNGADFNLNYIYNLTDFFAIDSGIHAYATSADTGYYSGGTYHHVSSDVNTTGAEFLARFYQTFGNVRPYISGGIGVYNNNVNVNGVSYTGYYSGTTNNTAGFVGKAGVDILTDSGLYFGVNVKEFSNDQTFHYQDGTSERVDLGGTSVNAVIGYSFN